MNEQRPFLHISGYRFTPIDDCEDCCDFLEECVSGLAIKGSLYVASEGINLMLAASKSTIHKFICRLEREPGFADIKFHKTWSDQQPFTKLIIKPRSELVPLERDDIDVTQYDHQYLEPETLKRWLDEKRPITLIDMRNTFEYELGSFEQATHLGLSSFRLLKSKTDDLERTIDPEQPVVTFCTGGIRCEKAGPYLEAIGYKNVFQLHGGILNYFKAVGETHWRGDCFVFDERVSINPNLQPKSYNLCQVCQLKMDPHRTQSICPQCLKDEASAGQSV